MDKEIAVKLVAASAAGALQPYVIKKYLITGANDTNVIPQLPYGMGKISSLVNNGASAAAIAAAVAGIFRKGPSMLRQSEVQMMLLAYGVPALVIGLAQDILGTYPATTATFSMSPSVTSVRSMGPSVTVRSAPQVQPKVYGSQKFY